MGAVLCKEDVSTFCRGIDERQSRSFSSTEQVPWHSDVLVDRNGCRILPQLPPPGQHPRLFFTSAEIPALVARFTHSGIAHTLQGVLKNIERSFVNVYYDEIESLSQEELAKPSKTTIERFFTSDDGRNVSLLAAFVSGIMNGDEALIEKAKKAALFYARVIIESKELADAYGYEEKPFHVWKSSKWDLHIGWMFGGSSYALLYDLIYNDLSQCEKNLMRRAITTAVRGRRSWGMGWPGRKIQSNWAGYHGDLLALSAVVEGEEGFDQDVYDLFSELMVNFLEYGVYDSGHTVEDCYALNLGMREGSIAFLVMARRGHNVFNHPNYKRIWTRWMPFALEPHESGRVYGGSSGNSFEYPSATIVAKYMFPKDPIIDYVYRHYMCQGGKQFERLKKMQSRLVVLAFAIPSLSITEPENPRTLNLDLDFACRHRGKVVMRSDWTDQAMWFTLDARPDGFLVGHDVCSRGAFVFNSDGRVWGACPEWNKFRDSDDYSIPHIDGVGQEHKAPFVKLLDIRIEEERFSFASADLKYAYNWTWTTWANENSDHSHRGYEPEPNDPSHFGFEPWWAPRKVYGERNVGFHGLHQWRKRFATVEKVIRSVLMVRASRPFIIIVDDVKKDEDEHEYSWAMTTPDDVHLLPFGANDTTDATLIETEGDMNRRLVIRNLAEDMESMVCSFRQIPKLQESAPRDQKVRQVVFKTRSTGTKFIFMLYSLPHEESKAPTTEWIEKGKLLRVYDNMTGECQCIDFSVGEAGQTVMTPVCAEAY